MAETKYTIKPQPSLRGFAAYVLQEFVATRGITPAEGAAYMIERWIDEHREELEKDYDLSLKTFRHLSDPGKNRAIPSDKAE